MTLVAGLVLTGAGSRLVPEAVNARWDGALLLWSADEEESEDDLKALALEYLRRIKFLQSHSASWSGKVRCRGR